MILKNFGEGEKFRNRGDRRRGFFSKGNGQTNGISMANLPFFERMGTLPQRFLGRPFLCIFGSWLAVHLVFWKAFGLRMGGDTGRYVGGAQRILEGLPLGGGQRHYLAYEGLLAFVQGLDGGLEFMVIVQGLLALGGAVGLYFLGRRMFSEPVGLLASIAFLFHPSIQRWNFYILTESLATNALILAVALSFLVREGKPLGILLLPVGAVLALARPEAPLFLLPIIFYLLQGRSPFPVSIGSSFIAILFILFWFRPSQPSDFGVWKHWQEGTYIWGYPGIGPPSGAALFGPASGQAAFGVREVLMDWPWFFKLTALRAFYFFSPTRPYFSTLHNTVAAAVTLPAYALGMVGTFAGKPQGRMLLWGIVILQGVLAVLTWSDWDNRWLDRVFPFLLVLAVGGAVGLWKRFGERGKSSFAG